MLAEGGADEEVGDPGAVLDAVVCEAESFFGGPIVEVRSPTRKPWYKTRQLFTVHEGVGKPVDLVGKRG